MTLAHIASIQISCNYLQVLLVLFFLFGEAMVALAFFIACFVRRARVGILIGIFLFIIGLVFESFVFSSAGLGYIWWDASAISQVAWQGKIDLLKKK